MTVSMNSARECIHLRPRLCGEKQHPHAEERSSAKNFIPDQTTAVETTSWRAWSRCRTPAAETLQCFRGEGCLLDLSPTLQLVVEKDGSDRRTGHPQFETFIFVCCALVEAVHFQPVSCRFSRFWSCWQKLSMQSMSLDSVGVTRVCWNLRLVRPGPVGILGLTVTASRHRRSTKNVKLERRS